MVSVAFAGIIPAHHEYAQVKTVVEPSYTVVETPTVQHVGSVVKNVPTGVSHHSSSVVHSHAHHVEPIYAHGVQKSVVSTPIVKKVVEHVEVAPVVQYHAAPVVHHAPAVKYVSAPVVHAPAVKYVAAPAHYAHAAPAHYVHAAPAISYAASYSHALPYAHHY